MVSFNIDELEYNIFTNILPIDVNLTLIDVLIYIRRSTRGKWVTHMAFIPNERRYNGKHQSGFIVENGW